MLYYGHGSEEPPRHLKYPIKRGHPSIMVVRVWISNYILYFCLQLFAQMEAITSTLSMARETHIETVTANSFKWQMTDAASVYNYVCSILSLLIY